MNLHALLEGGAPIGRIAGFLDGLGHEARWRELSALDRGGQRRLYEAAAESPPLDLSFFVPAGWPDTLEVVHHGRNTLPLPGLLRGFQKRFARPSGESGRLFGYNEGPTRKTVGPGYFVAHGTADGPPPWAARGAIVVDYFLVPDGPVPAGWPRVVPNSRGAQRLVYHHTRDFMRRVSTHASIGAAFKEEHPLDPYFVLCRET